MILLVKIAVSIVPVFVFLSVLVFLDSYKLVKFRSILQAILAGGIVGVVCFFVTKWVLGSFHIDIEFYSKYVSPVLEESLKAVYLIILFRRKKVGFMVDGAIYGFAIGAGFAALENIDYLIALQGANLFLWIIRGFGTAVMHGGTICIMAILAKGLSERKSVEKIRYFLPGWLIAVCIHSIFNHVLIDPRITTAIQLFTLPALITIFFTQSEKALRDWLELGMDTDVTLLEYIVSGQISTTKIGRYLHSLKDQFPGEILADMLCYLRIHLELAIRAKGVLLMQGAGFKIQPNPEIKERFTELAFLEKSIGKTGMLAVSPLLHTNPRSLWQLYLIDSK